MGIPTVSDRIAQMVVKMEIEPEMERIFHPNSYGYRPGKSAHEAIGQARQRCWRFDWVLDLDVKGFFDNIPHELLLRAVRKHVPQRWAQLYIERWLKAPMQDRDGKLKERPKGTPQGGVVSPVLSNLYLHYAFDQWMKRNYPTQPFERYADDGAPRMLNSKEKKERCNAIKQMKEGPSGSACRSRSQTALGCVGSMARVVSAEGKGSEKNRVR